MFKVPKTLERAKVQFQIENELVFYFLSGSVNLTFFQNLIDRIMFKKEKASEAFCLYTNFESTRIIQLDGKLRKLYTIDDEENLFTNNHSAFFKIRQKIKFISFKDLNSFIQRLWKALDPGNEGIISLESFQSLFKYGNLDFSTENLLKIWKYTDSDQKGHITYRDFLGFCLDLIHCLKSYSIARYHHENNPLVDQKIQTAVGIMNQHFTEFDRENNQEISFKDLKDCLSKENELFSRKEIEIILRQINPGKNFEYWKFDRILRILYTDYFDYGELMKEDKLYRYLVECFKEQDKLRESKLHYSKMKYALLIQDKLQLNKTQITIVLNFFDINKNPVIDYYKVSLLLRNIMNILFEPETAIQKLDIRNEQYLVYKPFEDKYDNYSKNLTSVGLLT